MAFYVSAIDSRQRRAFALGPFRRHGDALSHVDGFRCWASKNVKDGHWHAYGTAQDRGGHSRRGVLNEHYPDLVIDADGWCQRSA